MVLAEAFMKRNDLKKQITALTQAASQNLWQDQALPINFDKGIKVNPKVAYKQAVDMMAQLLRLNIAIANANTVNNETLRNLETTIARLSLVEQVLQAAGNYPGDKIRERNYGDDAVRFIENSWLINPQELQTTLKNLQEHKRALEKTLAHNNFITEVIFE